jgi:hypothetical protein
MRKIIRTFAPLVMTLFLVTIPARAQEHPEHPEHPKKDAAPKGEKTEKAEKKTEGEKAEKVEKAARDYSMDELDHAITSTIQATQKKNGGWYKMKDPVTKKTWTMKLDKVHRERLSKLDAKTYFACTDFKSKDGHTVDVDFFMKDNGEKLIMSDATIHKVDGKPRYNWKEKDGFWVRVPVAK